MRIYFLTIQDFIDAYFSAILDTLAHLFHQPSHNKLHCLKY